MSQILHFIDPLKDSVSRAEYDVYSAARVCTELDCELTGIPPAGYLASNPFGLKVLSIKVLHQINTMILANDCKKVFSLICSYREEKARIENNIGINN